ncbi:MAG: alpha/beta fold hydrolase, partial [Phycisphaerae bacterium]|nr:alpha/beta fold hydrolase [Phycisphaerae bacterium]
TTTGEAALRAMVAGRVHAERGDGDDADGLRIPWGIFQARLGLLEDDPAGSDSARFLIDRGVLVADLSDECRALSAGTNPYRRLPGERWRPIILDRASVPCWVYAPAGVSDDVPRPLVIALHGAGGDEAMFMRAYGAGQIRRLADEHGFVVASPLTYPLMGNAACFDALVDQLSADYAIDPGRIHILGHSMGGAAAGMLAAERAERLASAALLCGGVGFRRDRPPCPTLIVAGEIDPITPAAGLRAMHDRAVRAGLPVEYRPYDGYGHTLAVNAALPDTVRWLLGHRRGGHDVPARSESGDRSSP